MPFSMQKKQTKTTKITPPPLPLSKNKTKPKTNCGMKDSHSCGTCNTYLTCNRCCLGLEGLFK